MDSDKDNMDWQREPIREMQKLNLKLSLSKRIAYDRGLTGASVIGLQQSGKSSYCMSVMWELYNHDVEQVLNNIVFSAEQFEDKLREAMRTHKRIRCLLVDDASIFMAAAKYNTNRNDVVYLQGLGDSLGLSCKGILISSPSGDIIKSFRAYRFYKVIISFGRHEYDRIAKGYKLNTLPSGTKFNVSHEFTDNYDVRLSFYKRYMKMREDISLSALDNKAAYLGKKPALDRTKYREIEIEEGSY